MSNQERVLWFGLGVIIFSPYVRRLLGPVTRELVEIAKDQVRYWLFCLLLRLRPRPDKRVPR